MSLKHKKRANIKLENKDESKTDVKYFFLTSIHNYHSATETHLFHVVLPFKVEEKINSGGDVIIYVC